MAKDIFEVLESRGLVSEGDILGIDGLSDGDTVKLYEELYSTVFFSQENTTPEAHHGSDPFKFLASASMRADSTCGALNCRIQKIDFLGRFAALYSNEVILPLSMDHPDKVKDTERAKRLLSSSSLSLMSLRPLITAGFVRPVTMRTTHCEHVHGWVQSMMSLVHEVADWGAGQYQKEFKITYQLPESSPSGRSTVYMEGPAEILEHGSLVIMFDEGPNWRMKSWNYDADGKVELRGKKKLFFVQQIFNEIANSTTFYLAYGRQHDARLLTDLPGDTFLLNWMTEDEHLESASTSMRYLTHSIPLLSDLPIATLLRIRRQERDSFEAYRNAIRALTAEVLSSEKVLSQEEAKEVFKSKLEPAIQKLRAEASAERQKQTRRLVGGIAGLAAAVGIGAFSVLPIAIKGVLAGAATLAGGDLIKKAAGSACEHGVDLRKGNDLYFLLRLLEE